MVAQCGSTSSEPLLSLTISTGRSLSEYEEFEHQEAINTHVNINRFAAQLKRKQHPKFAGFDFWAIVAMRDALEHPEPDRRRRTPETCIPAAVVRVSMMGPEMYSWDKEFAYGFVR